MNDPKAIIDNTGMGARQWIVIALMVILNALDGFDVLSSAFASPGITKEWGIERSALGVVLSAELVGMGFGSILLGGMADRFGRKGAMLVCLLFMATGMYLASTAGGVTPMIVYRFVTGIGIGGMLAATNAVAAESSNAKHRRTAIAAYVAGYPLGAIIGGIAVVYTIGIPVMAANLKVDLLTATTYVTPFLTGDFIKVALTALIAFGLHRAYPKAFKN